jgi:hypothetical protein
MKTSGCFQMGAVFFGLLLIVVAVVVLRIRTIAGPGCHASQISRPQMTTMNQVQLTV